MFKSDREKMIEFIGRQLPEGEAMLVLASGPGGSVSAFVGVQDDDLEIRSNCSEWVTVREVYEYLRWEAMPGWEQRAWLRATMTFAAPTHIRLERAANRLERIAARFEDHTEIDGFAVPPSGQNSPTTENMIYGPIQVNKAEKEVTVDGKTYPLDLVPLETLACLVARKGEWVTRADMQSNSLILKEEDHLDRTIKALKNTVKALSPLIISSPRGYRLRLSDVVE